MERMKTLRETVADALRVTDDYADAETAAALEAGDWEDHLAALALAALGLDDLDAAVDRMARTGPLARGQARRCLEAALSATEGEDG